MTARRVSLGGVVVVAGVLAAASAAHAADVTYTKDVAPILNAKCVECHRPSMFAPMPLTSFDEVRPWARAIRQRVVKREMPPWHADGPVGVFKNDPRLSQQEIDTIVAWVEGGATRGQDRDLPPAPAFGGDGWTIGTPDLIVQMPEAYSIPADGTVPYLNFRIPTRLGEDRWIQAYEFKPSNRAIVHHIVASLVPGGTGGTIDEAAVTRNSLGNLVPSRPGVTLPPGVGRLMPANSDIILQMHYTTIGSPQSDRTSVGIIFAKAPPTQVVGGGGLTQMNFVIPPGAASHEVRASRLLQADTTIIAMMPHMHVRGKDMTYIAHYPDGRDETLLSVPRYDFNWQTTYELAEPRTLPKGTRLEVIAHFDNSQANRFNPDATAEVRWGDQTWEEMMIGALTTVSDAGAPRGSTARR